MYIRNVYYKNYHFICMKFLFNLIKNLRRKL